MIFKSQRKGKKEECKLAWMSHVARKYAYYTLLVKEM
jgi:hypothetical protein